MSETSFLRVARRSLEVPFGVTPMEPRVEPDPATRCRHDNNRTWKGSAIMKTDEESDDKPPGRPRPPSNAHGEVGLNHSDRAGVLAPLLKSLGWERVGIGAEFEIDNTESRKPTGRMRNLFGRQVAAQSLVGSSPTASAIRM